MIDGFDPTSAAFLAALECLSPAERVAFVLHDVFGADFTEIAETVGRTPDDCHQLAVSARKNLTAELRELTNKETEQP